MCATAISSTGEKRKVIGESDVHLVRLRRRKTTATMIIAAATTAPIAISHSRR